MIRFLVTAFLFTICTPVVEPARILGVFPMPSISHQIVFRALTNELAKSGHEVVTITPNPAFKNKESPLNLTEIDASKMYNIMLDMLKDNSITNKIEMKRGVIIDYDSIIQPINSEYSMFAMINRVFDIAQIKQIIEDKSQKFDLVIMEGLVYAPLIFSKIYNAPVVLFSSMHGTATNYETVGAVARHPLLHPYMFRSKMSNLNVIEKIKELHVEYKLWKWDQDNEIMDNKLLKSRFGPDTPTVAELKKNIVLLLVNSHPIFDGNRPVPPGVVYLGAVHTQSTKELPLDLKSYLDNSSRGVVYVSLGTNVRHSFMDKDLLDAFIEAFEKIPYDILWKFDGDHLDRVPSNVKIQKWFPQRDLLGHPNIKLFVMQGGLQSTDEAVDAEVPLVGIPMQGDQWNNVKKYVELGIGVQVDSYTMVAEDLVKAVNTVANDRSYKENIKKLKAIMQDQPEKPIERAVWWVEHVLRHKGSRHLLGPAAQMSWSEYLMLDVFIVFTLAISIIVVAIYYIVAIVLSLNSRNKVKQH